MIMMNDKNKQTYLYTNQSDPSWLQVSINVTYLAQKWLETK